MENGNKNKNPRPSRMVNVAFPKAKYGFYIAIFIVAIILLILYGNLIL